MACITFYAKHIHGKVYGMLPSTIVETVIS